MSQVFVDEEVQIEKFIRRGNRNRPSGAITEHSTKGKNVGQESDRLKLPLSA